MSRSWRCDRANCGQFMATLPEVLDVTVERAVLVGDPAEGKTRIVKRELQLCPTCGGDFDAFMAGAAVYDAGTATLTPPVLREARDLIEAMLPRLPAEDGPRVLGLLTRTIELWESGKDSDDAG